MQPSLARGLDTLLPPILRRAVRRAMPRALMRRYIAARWRRPEPACWPLPDRAGRPGFERYEYRRFSQNGEDGILRFLVSEIGADSRLFLEFGFGVLENNSLRLVLSEGFGGVFIDGSQETVDHFNAVAARFGVARARAVCAFLDINNLEDTIRASGLPRAIDLLSIDVDGNDYWFWEAATCVSPRIAVIEYNASFGPEMSCSVPYDPCFDRQRAHPSRLYHGASLAALASLGRRKGYSLIGCDSAGVNAFFVREDCMTPGLKALSPRKAYCPHRGRIRQGLSPEAQFNAIKDLPRVTIG